ncbi:MAG: hypothetical protein OXH77_12885, partial [Anaerolineaceae bacterium]|nr:hypothetical protein [Anaerolineaceae bacterium]
MKTYTAKLKSDPGAGVTVAVAATSGDMGAATVSPGSRSFTGGGGGNWATAQAFTVTAVNDGDAANESLSITHAATASSGSGPYHSIVPAPVAVAVTDAGHGVIASGSALEVRENDGTATYTLALRSQPGGGVTVRPATSDATHATVSGDLVFTNANWKTPQTVTVTGKGASGDTATITHGIHATNDATNYPTSLTGLPEVAVTVAADARPTLTAGSITMNGATITLRNVSGTWHHKRTVAGAGACSGAMTGSSFTLTSLTAGTTYTWAVYSDAACTPSSEVARVTFDTTAPAVPTVTLAADAASVAMGEEASFTVTANPAAPGPLAMTVIYNLEDDAAGDFIPDGDEGDNNHVNIARGATAAKIAVRTQADAAAAADGTVTVTLKCSPSECVVGTPALATVTVAVGTGPRLTAGGVTQTGATISLANVSGTWFHKSVAPAGTCSAPGRTGASLPLTGLTAGTDYTWAVYSDSSCATELARVEFTTLAAVPTVTVAADAATAVMGEEASFTVTADPAAAAGTSVGYRLEDAPGRDFILDADEGGNGAVQFRSASTTQKLPIQTQEDPAATSGGPVTVTLLCQPTECAVGSPASATATVLPTPGVALSRSSLSLTELGGASASGTYTAKLKTDPGSGVTVTVTATPDDPGAATVSPASLSFTGGASGNWATARTFAVTAAEDGDAAGESLGIDHAATASSGAGPYHNATPPRVAVTVADAGHGVVASAAALNVRANDGTAQYTLRLKSRPGGTVTVAPASDA